MSIQAVLEGNGFKFKKKTTGEYSCPCPFCGGVDRFCVWPEKNNAWCRQCDWKGDDIQLLRELEGFSFQEAAEATGNGHKVNNSKSEHKPVNKKKNEPDVTYDYQNEQGKVLFQVCRYNLPNGEKTFSQRRPDGKGGFVNNVKGVRLALYGLPEVIKAQDVFFCEGEKNTKDVRKLGFTSTCNPMGSGKIEKQQEKYKILDPLKNKNVFILADNDEPGEQHALQVAELVYPIAKSVKKINFKDLPEHGDVSDFIAKHGAKAKTLLIEKIAEAPEWTPPKAFYSVDDLLDLPPDQNLPVIGKGVMPHNSNVLFAGESGVGKSLSRLELGLHLAIGLDWLGFPIPRAKRVCIFQWENSRGTEQFRLNRMMKGLSISRESISQRIRWANRQNHYNLSRKGDRSKLYEAVKASGAEVVIYDCLSNIHSDNENDNIKMRVIMDVLSNINARLGICCILIHHFGKPSENHQENRYRIRGASSIGDWAYTILTLTRKSHEDKTLRKIEFTKVRDGILPKPFLIERDDPRIDKGPGTFLSTIYHEESLVSAELVFNILGDEFNGVTDKQITLVKAIREQTKCGERTAKNGIRNAVDMKRIIELAGANKRSKGYRIPTSEIGA